MGLTERGADSEVGVAIGVRLFAGVEKASSLLAPLSKLGRR